jgi:hypothetical protein
MRKLVLFLAVAGLLAFFGATASRAVAGGDVHATGAGASGFGGFNHAIQFQVSAHQAPDQGQVGFSFSDPFSPLDARVSLDCVNVFPVVGLNGAAWVAGTVTRASPQPNVYAITPGTRLEFYLVDGGNPSAAPVDTFDVFYEFAPCDTLPFFGNFMNVTQGNVEIKTG